MYWWTYYWLYITASLCVSVSTCSVPCLFIFKWHADLSYYTCAWYQYCWWQFIIFGEYEDWRSKNHIVFFVYITIHNENAIHHNTELHKIKVVHFPLKFDWVSGIIWNFFDRLFVFKTVKCNYIHCLFIWINTPSQKSPQAQPGSSFSVPPECLIT